MVLHKSTKFPTSEDNTQTFNICNFNDLHIFLNTFCFSIVCLLLAAFCNVSCQDKCSLISTSTTDTAWCLCHSSGLWWWKAPRRTNWAWQACEAGERHGSVVPVCQQLPSCGGYVACVCTQWAMDFRASRSHSECEPFHQNVHSKQALVRWSGQWQFSDIHLAHVCMLHDVTVWILFVDARFPYLVVQWWPGCAVLHGSGKAQHMREGVGVG